MEKKCDKCSELKEISEFRLRKNKSGKPYILNICRACENAYTRELYKRKQKDRLAYAKKYRAENPVIVKNRTEEWRENNKEHIKEYNHSYSITNRKKLTKQALKRRKENPERYAEYDARKRHKRKAILKNLDNSFDRNDWQVVLDFFGNRCAYCGNEGEMTMDHFVPVTANGEHTINNIICACRSCNTSKLNRNVFQWYPQQPFYSKQRDARIRKFLNYDPQTLTQQLKLVI